MSMKRTACVPIPKCRLNPEMVTGEAGVDIVGLLHVTFLLLMLF